MASSTNCTRAAGCACADCAASLAAMAACTRSAGCTCAECAAAMAAMPPPAAAAAPQAAAPREPDYTVCALGFNDPQRHLGSVYSEVTRVLRGTGRWRVRSGAQLARCQLLLGEALAAGVAFERLEAGTLCNFVRPRAFRAICRKAQLVATLREAGALAAGVAPAAFCFFPARPRESERAGFLAAAAARGDGAPWILKPSDGGKGERIRVMAGAERILAFLDALPEGSIAWVVQEYVERPLLLPGGRKFDMRVWALLAPGYRLLVYREGVLRTTSVPFSLDDLEDRFAHLSNHCVQVEHPDYGSFEATNEMWFHEFDEFLGGRFRADVWPQVLRVLELVFAAAHPRMRAGTPEEDASCFNLFGVDLMVDADMQVQLIEVNSSPAVAEALLPELALQLVAAVVEPRYPSLPALPDEDKWELVRDGGWEDVDLGEPYRRPAGEGWTVAGLPSV